MRLIKICDACRNDVYNGYDPVGNNFMLPPEFPGMILGIFLSFAITIK
jgi:hypothetical protein